MSTAGVVTQRGTTASVTTAKGSIAATATRERLVATAGASQGLQGPPGRPGVAAALVVEQTAPSSSWVVPHTLGRRPLVQVYADDGEIVYPDIVAGLLMVSVIFAEPSTGSVILF